MPDDCPHEAWDEAYGYRKCCDCGAWLDEEPAAHRSRQMSDARCKKCGMVFKAGQVYGYACPYAPNCGPMETEGMAAPWGRLWLDPTPLEDLTLPPPAGYVTRAEYDALAARLAEVERKLEQTDDTR